jgi:UDP-N-acetylglucosamine 2-epimerase (non-hydrolysing)
MRILIIFGTRPEAIKMAPVVLWLRERENIDAKVCVTGQHREMLDQVLRLFNIVPEFDLDIMRKGQDLCDITSKVLTGVREVLLKTKPDLVLVHGDTTTSFAAALAAFYLQIPVGHVEAGLRTNNIYSPWPEELNRQIISRVSRYNFCPTESNRQNLLKEGADEKSIIVCGNTVVDALNSVSKLIKSDEALQSEIRKLVLLNGYDTDRLKPDKRLILITGHRRESYGEGFQNICKAIKFLSNNYSDIDFVYPLHLNPVVRKTVKDFFGNNVTNNLFLIEPLDYVPFVYMMQNCFLILTDSGGIQEEAPSFGKPVIVMRDTTERTEAIEAGTAILAGTDSKKIISVIEELINNQTKYIKMSNTANPYGDGNAAVRIVDFIDSLRK